MDLCNQAEIRALLARHGFHFSKSMGQNFLIENWVPRDIAEASGAEKKKRSSHQPLRFAGFNQQTLTIHPRGSGRLPHWMPVSSSYSF